MMTSPFFGEALVVLFFLLNAIGNFDFEKLMAKTNKHTLGIANQHILKMRICLIIFYESSSVSRSELSLFGHQRGL